MFDRAEKKRQVEKRITTRFYYMAHEICRCAFPSAAEASEGRKGESWKMRKAQEECPIEEKKMAECLTAAVAATYYFLYISSWVHTDERSGQDRRTDSRGREGSFPSASWEYYTRPASFSQSTLDLVVFSRSLSFHWLLQMA